MSYKKLEIWQLTRDLVIGIHHMTITQLPKLEMLGRKINVFLQAVEQGHISENNPAI